MVVQQVRMVTYAVPHSEGDGPEEWRSRVGDGTADTVSDVLIEREVPPLTVWTFPIYVHVAGRTPQEALGAWRELNFADGPGQITVDGRTFHAMYLNVEAVSPDELTTGYELDEGADPK